MLNRYRQRSSRNTIRLTGFDYSSVGFYFVTTKICASVPHLSTVNADGVVLNDLGWLVQESWDQLPERFGDVVTDIFSIQPDHVHGILEIQHQRSATLADVVRAFKSISARSVNRALHRSGVAVWQRGYYERVIRNESELARVRNYVEFNWLKTIEQFQK